MNIIFPEEENYSDSIELVVTEIEIGNRARVDSLSEILCTRSCLLPPSKADFIVSSLVIHDTVNMTVLEIHMHMVTLMWQTRKHCH